MSPSQSHTLRIGTRGSPLALAQAQETKRRLREAHGLADDAIDIIAIKTSGDRIQDRALAEAGGKGLFTKEIEEALLAGTIDLAVHSSKDMPTLLPDGLVLSAFLPREDVRDALVAAHAGSIAALPRGARVGSASLRRQALLKKLRPDLAVELIRGNVETRIRKVEDGTYAATLLALAGLKRLGLAAHARAILDVETFPPAVGQGAICIETRDEDASTRGLLAAIDHAETTTALAAERAFLAVLDGSCRTPIAGHARLVEGRLRFHGMILRPDGSESFEAHRTSAPSDAVAMGRDAGEELRRRAPPGFFAV
jgi:hydroxymethylbilane synthase